MDAAVTVLAGALVGLATGLVPGIHVNLLAAVLLATPWISPDAALGLVAAGTVHTIVNILPATYLGVPDEDGGLTVLPAHRMLLHGQAATAVRLSVHASLLACLLAAALLVPYRWLLQGHGLTLLEASVPWVLAAVPLVLAWQERSKAWSHVPAALGVAMLAGLLGHVALGWNVRALVPVPTTPLLPLLSGLFGVPTLLHAIQSRGQRPAQDPPDTDSVPLGTRRSVARGVAAGAFTAVLPGLTAAVATALAHPAKQKDPRPVLATLSAVNTAHTVFALGVLWIIGRGRSGLAIAYSDLQGRPAWTGFLPDDLAAVLAAIIAAGAIGMWGTIGLDRALGRRLMDARRLEKAALGILVLIVVLLSGPRGVALLAVAALVGLVPLAWGLRRVHLASALILPILARHLGA